MDRFGFVTMMPIANMMHVRTVLMRRPVRIREEQR